MVIVFQKDQLLMFLEELWDEVYNNQDIEIKAEDMQIHVVCNEKRLDMYCPVKIPGKLTVNYRILLNQLRANCSILGLVCIESFNDNDYQIFSFV
jgi:hypothetical protein